MSKKFSYEIVVNDQAEANFLAHMYELYTMAGISILAITEQEATTTDIQAGEKKLAANSISLAYLYPEVITTKILKEWQPNKNFHSYAQGTVKRIMNQLLQKGVLQTKNSNIHRIIFSGPEANLESLWLDATDVAVLLQYESGEQYLDATQYPIVTAETYDLLRQAILNILEARKNQQ
jgi:hypothetical protein